MSVERNEYLERILNRQISEYDFLGIVGGFEFRNGVYELNLQTCDGGVVSRECHSLLEVAMIISFKLDCWKDTEVCNVPDFAQVALTSKTPDEFVRQYLEVRRYKRVDEVRRLWFGWLTANDDETMSAHLPSLAGVIFEDYELAKADARQAVIVHTDFADLGIDRDQMNRDLLESLRPVILKSLQLHRPHVHALYPLCRDTSEVQRLLMGDTGFLSARKAMMSSEQRDFMFAGDLGL